MTVINLMLNDLCYIAGILTVLFLKILIKVIYFDLPISCAGANSH